MRRMMALWTVLALCGVMCVSVAAAKGQGEATAAQAAGAVKLKLLTDDYSQPFPGGNQADIPELRYIREKLGIQLTIDLVSHGQFEDVWNMRVASGDLGDFFLGYGAGDDIVTNGGVMDLTPSIETYAPNAKTLISDEQWRVYEKNGRKLGLPSVIQSRESTVIYVRRDWLDKLGLKAPTTSDEFLAMLRAFRDRDPNGNGQKDEIPFCARGDQNMCVSSIEGMFGVVHGCQTKTDGQMVSGELTPRMRGFVSLFRTMYEEKLLDQEYMVNKRAQWTQKINSGLVGCWVHNISLAWSWQSQLNESIPEQHPVVEAIVTPVGAGNTTGNHGAYYNAFVNGWLVSSKCKNPEAVVKLYNWLLGKEGQAFAYLGVPDVTYTDTAKGAHMYDKSRDEGNDWRYYMFNIGPYDPTLQAERDGNASVQKIKQALDASTKDNPIIPADIGVVGLSSASDALISDLTFKRFPEMLAEIATGKKPLDYFDTWAAEQRRIAQPAIDEYTSLAKQQLGDNW